MDYKWNTKVKIKSTTKLGFTYDYNEGVRENSRPQVIWRVRDFSMYQLQFTWC